MRTTSKFSDNSPISTFYYASTLLATKYNFQVLEVLGGSFLPHKVRIALNEEGNFQGQSPMRVVSLLQQRLPVVENVQVSGTVDGSVCPMKAFFQGTDNGEYMHVHVHACILEFFKLVKNQLVQTCLTLAGLK